jgi:serine/threonine-protein kinase RsbW
MGAPDSRTVVSVDTFLESGLDSVDQAEEQVLKAAEEAGLEEESGYQLGLAVREIMTNAVVHGNRYSANKKVHLRVSRSESEVVVAIADEGGGFQPEEQDDPLAEENLLKQSGRGMMIVEAFVDEVLFQPGQGSGTTVILKKYLNPPAKGTP